MTAINLSALVGLGFQAIAAVWLVKLEIQKGRIIAKRHKVIEDLKYAIKVRKRLVDEVITQTKATNELLRQGAPKGTPDRYSLDEAVASYVHQMDDLARKIEDLKEESVPQEFPELSLLGAAILIIVGMLLQIPLTVK